jgi:hypothetical protein
VELHAARLDCFQQRYFILRHHVGAAFFHQVADSLAPLCDRGSVWRWRVGEGS